MIYRARTGTKVKVAESIKWPSEFDKEYFGDRITMLGNKTWKVSLSRCGLVGIRVGYETVVVPKFALDRAA